MSGSRGGRGGPVEAASARKWTILLALLGLWAVTPAVGATRPGARSGSGEATPGETPPLFRELLEPETVDPALWAVSPEHVDPREALADRSDDSYLFSDSPGEQVIASLTEPSKGAKDTYPLAVRVWIRGASLEDGPTVNRSVGIGLRVSHPGGTHDAFERVRLGPAVEAYYAEWLTNPLTGEDWTWSDLSDLEALFQAGRPMIEDGGGRVSRLLVEMIAGNEPDAGLLVAGPIFGAVTSSRIKVWVRTRGPCSVQIRYGSDEEDVRENRGGTKTTPSLTTSPEEDHTASVPISGLTPATTYFFTVLVDGYPAHEYESTNPYWFDLPYCTTFPPEAVAFDFDFAVGGDMHQYSLEHDLFGEMAAKLEAGGNPHFFVDLGDHTWIESDDLALLRQGFAKRRGYHAEARHLSHAILRKMPIFALGSDHDGVGHNYCKFASPELHHGQVVNGFRRVANATRARMEYFPMPDLDGVENGFGSDVAGVADGGGRDTLIDGDAAFGARNLHPGMVVIHDPGGEEEAYAFLDRLGNREIRLAHDLIRTSTGETGPAFEPGDRYAIWRRCLYYAFTVGDAELFVLDTRSKRDPNNTVHGDMLDGRRFLGEGRNDCDTDSGSGSRAGHLQRDWLVERINRSAKTWKFILCEIPFKHDEVADPDYYEHMKHDKWGDYDPKDALRTYLMNAIDAEGVIWIGADRHFCGLDDASHPSDPWPEVMVSPFCYLGPQLMPPPQGAWRLRGLCGSHAEAEGLRSGFGIVKVRGDSVTIELFNHDGTLMNNGDQDLTMTVPAAGPRNLQ